MKAKILSMALAICMIISLVAVFPASAADLVTTVCEDTTVINNLSYSNCYNSNNGASGPGAMGKDGASSMIIRIGDFVEYTLDVEEAGYYDLGINSQAHNINLQRWDAFVDGVKQCEFATWYKDWNDVVGDVYLPAGRHTLKLVPTAGHTWKYLLGINLTKKAIQEKAYWTVGKDYTNTTGRVEGDKVVLAQNAYAEYKVNVPEEGSYLLSLQHFYNFHSLVNEITVNGETTYTGAKLTGAYHSDATRASDRLMSPVAMIDLKAGENTVRITNTTNNTYYIISFKLEKSGGAVISASDFDSTTGNGALEGGALKLGYGTTASYDVEIKESGTYMVSAWSGSTANTVGIYDVWVDGAKKATKGFLFPDWRGNKQELCVVELEAGTRTITIGAGKKTSTHYFKTLIVEKVDVSKTLTKDNAITVEDEIVNVIDAKDYANDCAHAAFVTTEKGNMTLAPSAKASYKIDALRDGIYKISLKYATAVNGIVANVKVDGITVSSTYLEASTEDTMRTYELGDVTLSKGLHEIEILNSNSLNGTSYPIYIDEIHVERKARPNEAIYVSARDYVSVTDGTAGDSATGIEGVGIALRATDTAHYDVYFPEAGVYRLDVMAGNGTLNYNIYINDELMDWASNVLPKRYTSGLNDQVMQSICDVYIEEAGVHKVSIENVTGGAHYVAGFKLDKIAGEEETSIIHLASEYMEAYDATTGSNVAGVEGGNLTFGLNDTVTYDASTFTAGWYEVSVLVSRDTNKKSDIVVSVNDDAATFASSAEGSGSWNAVKESKLGKIYLPEGVNTVTLRGGGGGTYYLYAVILEPVILDEEVVVSGAKTTIELQPMKGEQEGTGNMVVGNLPGIRVNKDNSLSYNLNIMEAGTYRAVITTAEVVNNEVEIQVDLADSCDYITVQNNSGKTFVTFNTFITDLEAGETTLTISALSNDFAVGNVVIEKVGALSFDFYKTADDEVIRGNAVTAGDYVADININDASQLVDDMFFAVALYSKDANGITKLEKVDIDTNTAILDDSVVIFNLDGVTVEEGKTYTAKVFAWDGDSYCGEYIVY